MTRFQKPPRNDAGGPPAQFGRPTTAYPLTGPRKGRRTNPRKNPPSRLATAHVGISDWCLKTVTFAHELGHVLGFHHVDDVDDVMCTDTTAIGGDCNGWVREQMPSDGNPRFTDRLLRHAQLAFSLGDYYPYPGVPESWLAEPDGS